MPHLWTSHSCCLWNALLSSHLSIIFTKLNWSMLKRQRILILHPCIHEEPTLSRWFSHDDESFAVTGSDNVCPIPATRKTHTKIKPLFYKFRESKHLREKERKCSNNITNSYHVYSMIFPIFCFHNFIHITFHGEFQILFSAEIFCAQYICAFTVFGKSRT